MTLFQDLQPFTLIPVLFLKICLLHPLKHWFYIVFFYLSVCFKMVSWKVTRTIFYHCYSVLRYFHIRRIFPIDWSNNSLSIDWSNSVSSIIFTVYDDLRFQCPRTICSNEKPNFFIEIEDLNSCLICSKHYHFVIWLACFRNIFFRYKILSSLGF